MSNTLISEKSIMSLTVGPAVTKIVSVTECLEKLSILKMQLQTHEALHRKKLTEFLSEFNLNDVRQISEKYPNPALKLLTESAYHYYLTLNGSAIIILHGVVALITHLSKNLSTEFTSLGATILDRAMFKIQHEHRLQDFIKMHPDLVKGSPEEKQKSLLRQQLDAIEIEINALSEIERMAIEYYEVVYKAQEMISQLDALEISLNALATNLRTMVPVASVEQIDDSFGKSFLDDSVFTSSGDDLSAILSAKLQLGSSEDDLPDWDKLGEHSNRSSLAEALPPSLPTFLRQFELQQSAAPSSSGPSSNLQTPVTTPIQELPRPDH